MYKRILVPIDVSNPEPGSKSCPVARDMAKASGATIKLVSVLPGYNFSMVASFFPEDAQDKMKAKVLEDLRKIGETYFDEPEKYSLLLMNGMLISSYSAVGPKMHWEVNRYWVQ